jgi:hypothetical protein
MNQVPMRKRQCRICGATGFYSTVEFVRHHREKHPKDAVSSEPVPVNPVAVPPQPEVSYSFYNSPKELVLDLGEFVIRVERKAKA